MPMKTFVKTLEEVPEAYRKEYKAVDEKDTAAGFTLDVEDKDYKEKLDEYRKNNRDLFSKKEQLEAVASKYKDIDPDKYAKAMEALANVEKMEDSELIKAGKWEDVIKKRTGQMESTYKQQLAAKDKAEKDALAERDKLRDDYGSLLIETQFTKLVNEKATPKQGALTDILLRARRDWGVKDQKLQPRDIFNEKGDPISPEEYITKVISDSPYLFEASQGGGANGGKKTTPGNKLQVSRHDPVAMGRNAVAIAKGEAVVVD